VKVLAFLVLQAWAYWFIWKLGYKSGRDSVEIDQRGG
jgi:hypothetical protein